MKIAIIGGGLGGLSVAFFLSLKGHRVVVFEKEDYLGGLGAAFKEKNWQWPLEQFYHHFFSSDKEIITLAKQLKIYDKLRFHSPKSAVFVNNKVFQFDTLSTIFSFPYLNIIDKFRIGAAVLFLKLLPFWQPLEKITAEKFIKVTMGKNSYKIIWEPLLKSKFEEDYKKIPASWFWTRIKKRSFRLGYFDGGIKTLIDKLSENIEKNGGKILLNHEIKNLNDLTSIDKFDKTVITAPMQTFFKIVPKLPEDYKNKIQKLKMTGCLNLVLSLKEKFLPDNIYWLNINEADFPFVAVVEHTNFIDPKHYNRERLVYVCGYYPQNHRYFKMKKEDILKEFLLYLKKINPQYNFAFCLLTFELFSNLYAQPIPTVDYSQTLLPTITTPIPNLYWASLHHVYPEDRGVNYAIKLGKKIANEIEKNN